MISHEHRCIFVHIPKCGGTSIEDAIWPGPRSEQDLWRGRYLNEDGLNQSLHHLYARQIRDVVGASVFSSYFKFAIVRNPWDRAVSQYVYVKLGWPRMSPRQVWRLATFSNFLKTVKSVEDTKWASQHLYLYDDKGTLLVDHVGRFENLEDEFQTIATRIGLYGIELPHMKKSRRRLYQEYYTSKTRDMVAEIYQKDIELFGYSF